MDKNSNRFEKNINQYLEDNTFYTHSREQEGSIKYEFMMKIRAFSTRDRVLDGSINDAEHVLRYNQGDGLTLISTQYVGMRYLVQSKDIFNGNIQLYEKAKLSFDHPDFFCAVGRTRDPRIYGPIYKFFLKLVHGDSAQTLRVLVSYYRQKRKV